MSAPLPQGFRLSIDPGTRQLDATTLFGGSSARVMRLSARGVAAWHEVRDGPIRSVAAGALARRLTDAGVAHPVPPGMPAPDVTVIVPVRDRAALLARCLASLGAAHPVVVVDDGSADADAIADVAARHAARVLRRADNGGPGAARNTGLGEVTSEFVAFLDSDCTAPAGWIDDLTAHFGDPLVAAAAPRITADAGVTRAGRYAAAIGSLDLGDRPARVIPSTRVAYVPTAALVVRRSALEQVSGTADVFDPALRYGEDVDLIWRLHHAGWRIRYDPRVQVSHQEPANWPALLTRRFHYGTSAAPLAQRHPTALAPLVLHPWPAVTVAALLARRPRVASTAFAASLLTMTRTLKGARVPTRGVARSMVDAVHQTWLGIGRYGTQFAVPVVLAAAVAPGRRPRWGTRVAAASLLLGPPLTTWVTRRPALDPMRFTAGQLAEDVAYGIGVWTGCVQARCFAPVRPVVLWRPLRIGSATTQLPTGEEPS